MDDFCPKRFGALVAGKRGRVGLRQTARDIGVSAATLKRVEEGGPPDLANFARLCAWLEADPAEILGINVAPGRREPIRQESVESLADMMMASSRAMAEHWRRQQGLTRRRTPATIFDVGS